MRILLHNTGGIGFMSQEHSMNTLKSENSPSTIYIEYKIDIACISEVNEDWREVENNILFGTQRHHGKSIVVLKLQTIQKGQSQMIFKWEEQ